MRFRSLLIVLSVLTVFFACSSAVSQESAWKLGALYCLTGACAEQGNDAVKGAQLAIEEINAAGGVLGKKLVLIVQDTDEATSGAKAVSAYRQLRTDKDIHFFIGPTWTPAGLSLAPIVSKEREVIMASPSLGAPEFHKSGDNMFNLRGTDEVASRKAARYAFAKGYRRAAIFSSEQPWEASQANYFEDEFRKLGAQIAARVDPLPTVTDVKTEALKIAAVKPDMVFFASMILMGKAARELRQLGYSGFKMASYIDDPRLTDARGALEGTIFFSFQKPTEEFREKFKRRHRKYPLGDGAWNYDTVNVFAEAVKQVKTFDPDIVKREILKLKLHGASGPIEFDNDGCVTRQPLAWEIVNSRVEPRGE